VGNLIMAKIRVKFELIKYSKEISLTSGQGNLELPTHVYRQYCILISFFF